MDNNTTSNVDATNVKTIDENSQELNLSIISPGHKILQEAQMAYNIKMTELITKSVSGKEKLLSRQQLDQHLSELGIWTPEDARQFLKLQLDLRESELKLKKGGIKVSEAKTIAMTMRAKRLALLVLYNRRSQFDAITMEAIADNYKFKFLLTKCVFNTASNMPFFADVDDYEDREHEQSTVEVSAAMAGKIYGYDQQTEANLVENKWLQQFNFTDHQGRLIDKDNRLVDMEGRLVNEDGRFVDKNGNLVDNVGRPIDNDGNFVVNKPKPFLDEEGNPVTKTSKKKKKKIKRKTGSQKQKVI